MSEEIVNSRGTSQTASAPPRRLRVLVIAESCNPEWESVPLVGWSHYHALTELVDTHLITRNWNRPALDRAGLVEGRDYTAYDTDWLVRPVFRLVHRISGPSKGYAMLTALTTPAYLVMEQMVWRQFGAALRAGEYDLVHRITPLSAPVPSLLASRCRRLGIPFILGPMNGGLPWPKEFPTLARQEGEFLARLRWLYRWVPGYRVTRDASAAIMVGGASAMRDLPTKWHAKAIYVPENGIDLARFPRPPRRTPDSYRGRPLRAVFLGRLVPFKGCDMLIEAAAPLLREGRMVLEIIGFGPERERLDRMVAELGLGAFVTFAGKLSHFDLADRLKHADVLTFPSVREFGGAVVLEAMAAGVVPIVVDYGGPAELVSPASGYLLPMAPREDLIVTLRRTLGSIVADPGQLAEKSWRGVERVFALFAWPAKARQTFEIYRWVLGWRADKPDMGLPFKDPVPAQEFEAGLAA